jgi:hypothetical protein
MNRMRYAPAAGGGLLSGIVKFGSKLLGIGKKAAPIVAKTMKNPLVQTAALIGAGEAAGALLSGGGGGSGASGGWSGRRRRGITATELRGYRKVANLIHKEGMVSKRARGRH